MVLLYSQQPFRGTRNALRYVGPIAACVSSANMVKPRLRPGSKRCRANHFAVEEGIYRAHTRRPS